MITEERVKNLEDKLDELIELLKFMIQVDDGIKAEAANIILHNLDQMQEELWQK